jgi:hypothetical protein
MHGQPDRIEQLKADLAELHVTDPSANRDQLAVRLGLFGFALGVALPVLAYFMSHGTTNALAQRDAIVMALIGVSCAVVGGALYLRGALAGFLRFWLVRDLHERRAQTDRIVEGLGGGDRPAEGELT